MSNDPGDLDLTAHEARNRASWDAYSDEYQAKHGAQLADSGGLAWGTSQIPESELRILATSPARTSSSSAAAPRSGRSRWRGRARGRSGSTSRRVSSSTPAG